LIREAVPAIVVSGHTMALAVVRSLGEAGIPVSVLHYDPRDMAQASRYVVTDVRIPHPLYDEAGFIDAIVEEARRLGRSIIMPASDDSLVGISRNKGTLARYGTVACPDWAVTQRLIDKTQTYALAEAHGVPAPRTLVPRSAEELESFAGMMTFPMLLKPAESHLFYERFKIKMILAHTMAELRRWYAAAADAGLATMLQELIPGLDSSVVNYNAYFRDGVPLAEFTARQLRKAPPRFGSPRVVVSARIPEVIEPGRRVLSAMGFNGFACTEFKQDRRNGIYKLMEVNGRHNLSGLLAVRSGVNFPLIEYRYLTEGVLPERTRFRSGIYWTDFVRDAGYSLASLRSDPHSPAAYVAPYARRGCDAIFDRHDMGPFAVRVRYLLRTAIPTAQTARGRK
jgi:D-aspartate ligase